MPQRRHWHHLLNFYPPPSVAVLPLWLPVSCLKNSFYLFPSAQSDLIVPQAHQFSVGVRGICNTGPVVLHRSLLANLMFLFLASEGVADGFCGFLFSLSSRIGSHLLRYFSRTRLSIFYIMGLGRIGCEQFQMIISK